VGLCEHPIPLRGFTTRIVRYQDSAGQVSYAAAQPDGSHPRIEGDLFGQFEVTGEPARIHKLLAPVVLPTIWCIRLNYHRHAAETGAKIPEFPVVFAKGRNAVQNPGDPILIPTRARSAEVDYECELVAIIGRMCKNVPRERAHEYILGYTCGNDVSARDWQLKMGGRQWCRGKTFDTFAPLGPCLVTPASIPNPNALRIQAILNGRVMQDWNTNDMIFDVPALVEFLSQSTTLLPGTAIFTGTPHGVGMSQQPPRWLPDGDQVSIVIEGIGTLTNPVRREES
jgi:2-keto-4-pentenoate hydratase/2-oxohepta-3-ene-1,7-dioic acid hydratase in catechol pathway